MAAIIYSSCAFGAFLCAWLLLKAYFRTWYKVLLWGGICFSGITLSNALLVVDKLIVLNTDLATSRYFITLASMIVLLYGLIWDEK